jgi:hypothetical protein
VAEERLQLRFSEFLKAAFDFYREHVVVLMVVDVVSAAPA